MNELEIASWTDRFLEQSELSLRKRIADGTHELATGLQALGMILRQQGKLEAAASVYNELKGVKQDPEVSFVSQLLNRRPLSQSEPRSDFWPAPFVCFPNFLGTSLHARLLEIVMTEKAKFAPLPIKSPDRGAWVDESIRKQLGRRLTEPLRDSLVSHLEQALKEASILLDRPVPQGKEWVTSLSVTLDGHFGRAHTDEGAGSISFAYYFHKEPKRFTGGDLLLYDTQREHRAFNPTRFTRICNQDNFLVMFASDYFHAITPVVSRSGDWSAGRFAFAGHIPQNDEQREGQNFSSEMKKPS